MDNSQHTPKLVCRDCGAENYSTSFTPTCPEKKLIDSEGVCYYCAYWLVRITQKHQLVIDGRIYSEGDTRKAPGSRHAGMAGRRFDIEYFDGRRVTTHDLWSGSDVPARYRHLIPDTARFGGGAKCVKVGETICWNPSRQQATGSTHE